MQRDRINPYLRVFLASLVIGVGILYLPRIFSLIVVLLVLGLLTLVEKG